MTLLFASVIGNVALVLGAVIVLILIIAFFKGGKSKQDAGQIVADVKDLGKDVVTVVKDEVTTFKAPVSGSTPVSGSK